MKKVGSVTGFFKNFFRSTLERNFASIKTTATKHPIILFDKDFKIRIISFEGIFQEFELDCEGEKITKSKEPYQLINQNISMSMSMI